MDIKQKRLNLNGNKTHYTGRPAWVHPWGYKEAFVIAGAIIFVGFALEWVTPESNIEALLWPWNGLAGCIMILIPVLLHLSIPENKLVKWMSRVPASMGAIAAVVFTVLIMGLFVQGQPSHFEWINRMGLTRMTTSWPFLLSIFWFLFVLGMTTVRRSIPFRGKNTGFLLNHLGLWIVIADGILGNGDLQRVTMTIQEGQTVWYGSGRDGQMVEMPLALELKRFHMDEYPPKMGIFSHSTESLVVRNVMDLVEIQEGRTGNISGWNYHIHTLYMESSLADDGFEPANGSGSAPSAFIELTNDTTGETHSGWITCGSFAMKHQVLPLNDEYSLAMTVPQAKRYMSLAQLYTKNGDNRLIDIEVNQPFKTEGWKLYQYSYDDRFGKWSPVSVIEAVRDPWLPVVYSGFIMMMLGAVYVFWKGSKMAGDAREESP